ncbi:secretion protein EccC [Williamsia sp. Leaf354]|uniref:type VII secretion protein EccCa n=1 Tax=Williamsia sp. Leaf354 TaxID=1736349 RepID=UPI0006F5FBF3|nr:type VII secretion protein EccCa [Williamsia sp. Leaf354]KQS00478.1 secretion protein EccC [Williamsia sp. Leaf354]
MTTEGFVRRPRPPRPRLPGGEMAVQPPPEVPRNVPGSILTRLLPLVMVVAMVGMMALFFTAGSSALRNPVTLLFPMMMVMSMVGMFASGGRSGGPKAAELNEERKDYLRYLGRLRKDVDDTANDQLKALSWSHPSPGSLLPAVGSRRMWERRLDDADFAHVRLGVGAQRLATRLARPETGPLEDLEPVSVMALRRFIRMHAVVRGLPTAVSLRAFPAISIEGATAEVNALARSMLLQLCTFHGPDLVRVAIVCRDPDTAEWSWAKWLPHVGHPTRRDGAGPARMLYQSLKEFEQDNDPELNERPRFSRNATAVAGRVQWVVVLAGGFVAGDERCINDGGLDSVSVIGLSETPLTLAARRGTQLVLEGPSLGARSAFGVETFAAPDQMPVATAESVARRMARYSLATAAQLMNLDADTGPRDPGLMRLIGVTDAAAIEPDRVWRPRSPRDRLRVPVGVTEDGQPLEIDIKEAAENGMGPHGLCIGATGSGKSEFLRTLVLSMVTTHAPESLNLILVDFKGGATFLGLDELPHVAAVITNLEDELAMVDRMRDALAGEMNRRQELLRSAGNFANVADYEKARLNGAGLDPLPALFIVVDEFSELLSQKPDFAELFVMIGRLGRSLQMHLLLASQRLEEGKLRGLDSHLSYRIGLKTFSASESRAVLGVPDAYHLPAQPGSAYLKCDSQEPTRFNASYVSGPYLPSRAVIRGGDGGARSGPRVPIRVFSATYVPEVVMPEPTVIEEVMADDDGPILQDGKTVSELDMAVSRLVGHGRSAHEVWLPPLEDSPPVSNLLRVRDWRAAPSAGAPSLRFPVAIVDRPYDQRRDVLELDLSGAQGHAAIVGGPQSGKSTALRSLIMAAAVTHTPEQVQFYCLDFGGGTLAGLAGLPHVGSVATRLDEDRVRRTVAEVMSVLRQREARFRDLGIDSMQEFRRRRAAEDERLSADKFGDVFLVVDGWATIRSEFEIIEDAFSAIAAQGLSFGVHLIITASRWMEIRPVVKDLLGTRIELRLGDSSDSEVDRKVAATVPVGRPGRGLSPDKLHMLLGLPRLDGSSSVEDLSTGVATAVMQIAEFYPGRSAPGVRMLPERVAREDIVAGAEAIAPRSPMRVTIGIDEAELAPVTIDFAQQPHFLAFADVESGKTTLLRTILRGLVANGAPAQTKILLIDYRRSLLGEVEGNHLAGYASTAAQAEPYLLQLAELLQGRIPGPDVTPAQLRDRSWWQGPEIYVVVDDYDMVAVASGNPLAPLVDLLAQGRDIGVHLILTRRSGGASRSMYDPIISRLKDLSVDGLAMSASKDEGVLLGTVRSAPRPPGRGVMVSRGGDRLIQVAWSAPLD